MNLKQSLQDLAREVVEREAPNAAAFERASEVAESLHSEVASAVEAFNAITRERLPQLQIELLRPRVDDKHLRAVQFELRRGLHKAVVTVKCRGEVTLVGPFRVGKKEGPCRTHPIAAEAEIGRGLEELLRHFVEQATRP